MSKQPAVAAFADPILAALVPLLDAPIVVIDVGCRWGFADEWLALGERAIAVGFDPDAAECARLEAEYADRPGVRVVPQALGGQSGPATLYLTKDPAGSSILPTHPDTYGLHPDLDGAQLVGTEPVELITLDEWWSASSDLDAAHVIKLDTQGSELDILRGAQNVLRSVRAVQVEVQFNELYEGVPLFGEVDAYLRSCGFMLWKFRNLVHYTQWGTRPSEPSVGVAWFDSRPSTFDEVGGQLFWCDAFFVASDMARPVSTRPWEALARDATIAHLLRFDDLSVRLLTQARADAPMHANRLIDAALSVVGRHAVDMPAEASHASGAVPLLADPRVVDLQGVVAGGGWEPPPATIAPHGRSTGLAPRSWIDLPFRLAPGTLVALNFMEPTSAAELRDVSVEVNGMPVSLISAKESGLTALAGLVPSAYASVRDATRLVVRVTAADLRDSASERRSIQVKSISLTPPSALPT